MSGRRSGDRLATTLVATKNVFIFFFHPFFSAFSPLQPFLIGVLGSKNLISEHWRERQRTQGRHLSRPQQPFLDPPSGHFIFCRRCGVVA